MGEHRKTAIKGDGYKAKQNARPKRRYIEAAHVTEKWMVELGYKQGEDGRWRLS